MNPSARHQWILEYIRGNDDAMRGGVDVYNAQFVREYRIATKARGAEHFYGADTCPQLGRDLSKMKKEARLTRRRVGVSGVAGMGFARWVWSYNLNPRLEALLSRDGDVNKENAE